MFENKLWSKLEPSRGHIFQTTGNGKKLEFNMYFIVKK